MYIIHLVLTCLIGLVTFMPVNIQLVSEGNDGCFAEVSLVLSWEIHQWLVPWVCRVPLPHIAYRFLKGHLHSKALFLEKVGDILEMSLVFKYLGCFHVQRGHPLHFIAMEMDVHTYPRPLTDDLQFFFCFFFHQNPDIFQFVKNYLWPLLYHG